MATALELILAGRGEVIAFEGRTTRAILDEYERVMRVVQRELDMLQARIDAAIAAGVRVDETWLRRQQWYLQAEAVILREIQRLMEHMARMVGASQSGAITIAAATASRLLPALRRPLGVGVATPAFARWVTATQAGTPIRATIDAYGGRISLAVRQAISDSFANGKSLRAVGRQVVRDVGPSAVEHRIRTLVRTEALRAYRGGLADALAPLQRQGVITGWRWRAGRGACLACLAMHGRVFRRQRDHFHPGCQCIWEPVFAEAYASGDGQQETGEAWLNRQPAEEQRKRFPTQAHYDAYKAGTPISKMVGTRRDRVWGPSIRIKPMREIRP